VSQPRYINVIVRSRLASLLLLALAAASSKAAAPRVLAVDVDGMIHPVTAEILSRAIQQAKQEDAALLLVRLNTPGGLMDAMRESIEKIVAAPMPVVTYVAPSGARGFGGFLHPGSRRRRGHGARHQYRRGASGADDR